VRSNQSTSSIHSLFAAISGRESSDNPDAEHARWVPTLLRGLRKVVKQMYGVSYGAVAYLKSMVCYKILTDTGYN